MTQRRRGARVPSLAALIRMASPDRPRLSNQALQGTGLTIGQVDVLTEIGIARPRPLKELATRLAMDRSAAAKSLLPLVRAGLVNYQSGAGQRSQIVYLTPAGKCRLVASARYMAGASRKMKPALGIRQLRRLDYFLLP